MKYLNNNRISRAELPIIYYIVTVEGEELKETSWKGQYKYFIYIEYYLQKKNLSRCSMVFQCCLILPSQNVLTAKPL
jgi:hypothetical protein